MSVPSEAVCTSEDYWGLPEGRRAEFIDGELLDMALPSWEHQQVTFGIARALAGYIDVQGGHCKVCPAPVAVNLDGDDSTWVEPDVVVVCDPAKISERGCEGAPDLVCEVVSPSTRRRDYVDKMWRYARAGVREYWVVDPASKRTTVYRFEQGTTPVLFPFAEPVPVGIFEDLSVNVGAFVG